MSVYFQSLCSGSDGNCLTVWSDKTRLVIDCGLSSMKRTRQTLTAVADISPIDGVLLTHIHSDHISHYPLRTLEQMQLPVHLSQDCVDQLKDRHFNGYGFSKLNLHPHQYRTFSIGDFRICPFELLHHPSFPTCGFEIWAGDKKLVIATDFYQWENVVEHFIDSDFIVVESNHDLALLGQYYNPNSRFHLPNPSTAALLVEVCNESRKPPRSVVLAHLSNQRNTPKLAIRETAMAFVNAGLKMPFELIIAPHIRAGQTVLID